ncbi:MAG: thioredoxin family protein [Bacteroidales bacterium]|nr:thioredoxin family protein [Bacteroidales bacterium]
MEAKYSTVETIDELNELIEKEDAVLVYFSHEKCNVCKVLKPTVAELLENNFPKVKMVYSDTVNSPEIAGQNSVFAVPTILVFMGGREYIRKSRNIGIIELSDAIERPYNMMFE